MLKKNSARERTSMQKRMHVFLSVLIVFATFSFWPTAHAAIPANTAAPLAVEQYAQLQANALGTSDPDWLAAKLEYFPLGPGTHGWLVYASVQNKQIGYMVISITEQGQLILSEYGLGEQSLYNNELLGQALERQHINLKTLQNGGWKVTRHYAPPLLAYWKVARANHMDMYIDASNGDLLPNAALEHLETSSLSEHDSLNKSPNSPMYAAKSTFTTSSVHVREPFDPSLQLTWLTSEPLRISQVQAQIVGSSSGALVFAAEERNLFYGGPLPVSGHQLWHAETSPEEGSDNLISSGSNSNSGSDSDLNSDSGAALYVGLGGSNSIERYVPLRQLLRDGGFYMTRP